MIAGLMKIQPNQTKKSGLIWLMDYAYIHAYKTAYNKSPSKAKNVQCEGK